MSDALEHIRYSCGIAGEEVANYVDKLQAKVAELEEEILIERSNGDHWSDAYSKWVNTDESARRLIELQEQLAKAEQRVAEAIVDMLQQKHRNCFGAHSFYLAASVATANGEWRKFVKEAGKFDVWKTNPYTKVLETSIEQLTEQRDLAVEALENCRLLAARHRKEEWAGHIMRFCKDAGLSGSPIRNDSIKETENNKAS